MVQICTIDHKLLEFADKRQKWLTAIMSKKYRLRTKKAIDKLEASYCGPLYYAVPL
jgi:hypothetical protein